MTRSIVVRAAGVCIRKGAQLAAIVAWCGLATTSAAQGLADSARIGGETLVNLISTDRLDRHRLDELAGGSRAPLLLRSTSVLLAATDSSRRYLRPLGIETQFVYNSDIPYSVNDGALWAGRGVNSRTIGGFYLRAGPLRMVIAPEFVTSANDSFRLFLPIVERPPIPADRSEWQFPWYAFGPYSIDMPTRFGDARITRLYPGQSSVSLAIGPMEVGAASENNWWGPGLANALVLSNNAPGFPHLFVRPTRAIRTRVGAVDFRWLVGGLRESKYFDTLESNDLRSISAAAVTLSLHRPAGLTVGAARSVWGTSAGWSEIPLRWLEVFHGTGRPSDRALNDSSLYPGGRDQLYSIFARWVFPRAGLEAFAEWGRTEFPVSLRDALVAPNHTQAYTAGLQWRRGGFRADDFWRLHLENTSVEQSSTFRTRPTGVWYTSRQVIQGYTNEGQPLGAAVGPGSSGQLIAVDYFLPRASYGLRAGRTRLNEDVRSISPILDFKRWCTHDVNLYGGPRASVRTRLGLVSADLTFAHRIQAWFQVQSGCPRGDAMHDEHNTTLTLTFSPRG